MKQKFNIEVPLFPGYYESWLYSSDEDYWEVEEEIKYYQDEYGKKLTQNDFEFDFKRYCEDMNKVFVEAFMDVAPDFVLSAKYTNMFSPQFYNYSTDRIYADVKFAPNWQREMKKFIAENEEWLAKRIHEDWSSCSGFISFIMNYAEDFYEQLFKEMDETYISIMLSYMLERNNPNIVEYLALDCRDKVPMYEYIHLKESVQL